MAHAQVTPEHVAHEHRTPGRRALTDVIVLWLASRVLFEAIALLAVGVAGPARDARPGWFGLLHHWDSNWFSAILTAGYFGPSYVDATAPGARAAFFPGYPLLARPLAWLLGGGGVTTTSALAALWLVPFLASLAAAFCLYRAVDDRFGTDVARWSAALLLLGPYAVFLAASYSEALYLAFAIAAWWAVTRKQYLLAGLLGAAASFTRINGAFLAVALLVLYIERQRRVGARIRWWPLAAITTSFAGVAVYLGWLWARTGHATAWLDAQANRFGHQAVWPWVSAFHQLKQPVVDPRPDHQLQAVLEIVVAIALVAAVLVLIRVREWAAAVYVVLCVISFVTNTTYLSLARNSITLFPVVVLAAVLLVRSRRRRVVVPALAVTFAVTLVNAVLFSLGYWAD